MKRLGQHHFYRSTLLILGCVGFLLGAATAAEIGVGGWPLIITLGLATCVVIKKAHLGALLLITCFGLCLGWYRGGQYLCLVNQYQPYYDQKIAITATAISDAVYGDNGQLSFDVSNVQIDGQALIGKIGIAGFGEDMVYQGDQLEITGKLRDGLGSYKGWISYATLTVVRHGGTMIDNWRRQFGAALTSALPEPLAPFGMGLLIGQRNTLPDETSKTLLWVGLTHIIAVSGYNLTILIKAARMLLKKGSKYQTTIVSLALIGVFLLFAGNCPSIVRAALVSMISLLAWYYGRDFHPVLLILLAASITVYANPSYIWSDSGWWLSFLAFIGVVVVSPLVLNRVPKRFSQSLLGAMVLETLCAEVMTMPYVLYVFGQTSLASLPANVLIASFVPIAMLLTMVAGLAGWLIPTVAGWLAWPANWVLNYMLDGCTLLSRVPHVFINNLYLKPSGLALWYVALAIVGGLLIRHKRRKHVTITDRTIPNDKELRQYERTFQMVHN